MENNDVQKLYTAVSSKFDIGDYDSFSKKISDANRRKELYNLVSERGFDLGDYDKYESRLLGALRQLGVIADKDKEGGLSGNRDYSWRKASGIPSSILPESSKETIVSTDTIKGFAPAFKQGVEGLYEGGKFATGEIAGVLSGSQREYLKALEQLDEFEKNQYPLNGFDSEKALKWYKDKEYNQKLEQYKADKKEWKEGFDVRSGWDYVKHVFDYPERPESPYDRDLIAANKYSVGDEVELKRAYNAIGEALKESGGDVGGARKILSDKANKEQWSDRVRREAGDALGKFKPTEGLAAWTGALAPQMIGSTIAIGASISPYTRFLARPLAAANMAAMSTSSGGGAMADARKYGASSGDVLRSGVVSAGLEWVTEKIPFDRYFNGVQNHTRKKLGKEVVAQVVGNSTAKRELADLLKKAGDEFPGKFFSKKGALNFGGDVFWEGLSEFVAEGGGAMIPVIYANEDDYPTLKGILEQGWEGAKAGFFMGGILGGASNTVGYYTNRNRRKEQGKVALADIDGKVVEVVGQNGNMYSVLDGDGNVSDVSRDDVKDYAIVGFDEFDGYARRQTEENLDKAVESGRRIDFDDSMEVYQHVAGGIDPELRMELMGVNDISEYLGSNPENGDVAEAFFTVRAQVIGSALSLFDGKRNKKSGSVITGHDVDGNPVYVLDETSEGCLVQYEDGIKKFIPKPELRDVSERSVDDFAREFIDKIPIAQIGMPLSPVGNTAFLNGEVVKIQRTEEDGSVIIEKEDGGVDRVSSDSLVYDKGMPDNEVNIKHKPVEADGVEIDQKIVQSTMGSRGTEGGLGVREANVQIPLTKDGKPDYNAMPPDMFAREYEKEFGPEESKSELLEMIADLDSAMERLQKKKPTDRNERADNRREVLRLTQERENILQALKRYEPKTEKSIQEQPMFSNEEEISKWVAENSEDVNEILGTYEAVKGLRDDVSRSLPRWQQELLGRKIKPDSFYENGDRNHVTPELKKGWLSKDGRSVDELAHDLSSFGVEVTNQDIIDFMMDHPSGRVRQSNDEVDALGRRFSKVASQVSGMKIGRPDSPTGKLFVEKMKTSENAEQLKEQIESAQQAEEEVLRSIAEQHEAEQGDESYEPLTEDEISNIITEMKDRADDVPVVELSPENWLKEFGEDGVVETPVGKVKMGENQYLKMLQNKREGQFGMVKPTSISPDIVVEQNDDVKDSERGSKLLFVKTFSQDGKKFVNFESVTVRKDGMEVSVSSHILRDRQLTKKLKEEKLIWNRFGFGSDFSGKSQDLSSSVTLNPNDIKPGTNSQINFSSENKDIEVSGENKDIDTEIKRVRVLHFDEKEYTGDVVSESDGRVVIRDDVTGREISVPEKRVRERLAPSRTSVDIVNAESVVNTSPTEAQKEAGNYRMGHVKINGFDVTIEQPKGSVRSGVDENGKEWSVTMNHTYGYLKGTKGKDGDHIDVFVGQNPDSENVFVVDQVNQDGSFDEHKVMIGFDSIEDAKKAYLSNYEVGWQGLGNITGVNIEEFREWSDSGTRKIKPFAEYKMIKDVPTIEEEAEIEAEMRSHEEYGDDGEIRYRDMTKDEMSSFAWKHGIAENDVKSYSECMRNKKLQGAIFAFSNIKRSVRLSNSDLSFGEFVKAFASVKAELYEKFGDVDGLRDEYVQREMEQRNMMEASRKLAEEEIEAERKRLEEFELMTDKEMDAAYFKAMKVNDEVRMRDIINEAARRNGYVSVDEFRMAHRAPSYDEEGVDKSMIDVAANKDQIRESLNEQLRMNRDKYRDESATAISEVLSTIDNGEKATVMIYRAAPKSLKEGSIRNGDWVSLSKSYVKIHGDHVLNGDYRIMKEVVPAENLYWDGNDINEWGYDDRSDYRNKDTKNNRKLNDLITRDDNYDIIPPSKRFDARNIDRRFRFIEENDVFNLDILKDVNRKFNSELQQQIDGKLPKGHVYKLGNPSGSLLSAGVPNLPIELSAERLSVKASKEYVSNHPFDLKNVENLPEAISNPIAVFGSTKGDKSNVILTELRQGKSHFVVILKVQNKGGGRGNVQINDIRSLYPKDNKISVVDWINSGLTKWVDKEKVAKFISVQWPNYIGNGNKNSNIVSAANVVKSFENPTVLEGEISSTIDELSDDLGVKVNRVKNRKDLPDGIQRRMKSGRYPGLYDVKTGEVYVVMDEVLDVADAQATVLHEVLGHKGIHGLFGDKLPDFCKRVLESMDDSKRAELVERHGGNEQLAAEEYVASFAEGYKDPTAWEKVKAIVMELLREMGIDLRLMDNDLKYVLWKAKNGLRESDGVMDAGKKMAKDREVRDALFRNNQDALSSSEEFIGRKRGKIGTARERLIDMAHSVKELSDFLRSKGVKIRDFEDAYSESLLSESKSYHAIKRYQQNVQTPLNEAIVTVMQSSGANFDDVCEYVMAKHAPERNREIGRRKYEEWLKNTEHQLLSNHGKKDDVDFEKRRGDFEKKKRDKEHEFNSVVYAGISNDEAADIVAAFESKCRKDEINALWSRINAATKFALEVEYKNGFISKGLFDHLNGMFKYYVPLKGWEENDGVDYSQSERFSTHPGKVKKAKGRKTRADNPFSYIEMAAEGAILKGNRNHIRQCLYNMCVNNPDKSLYSISKTYYVEKDGEWVATNERPDESLFQAGKAKTELIDTPHKDFVKSADAKRYDVDVWVGGEKRTITFAQGEKGLDIADAINREKVVMPGRVSNAFGKATRYLSSINTSKNPEFVLRNFERDFLYAVPAYAIKGGNSFKLMGNLPKAFKALNAEFMKGSEKADSELNRYMDEYLSGGGKTGFVHSLDIESRKRNARREINRMMNSGSKAGKARAVGKAMSKTMEYLSDMSENSIRFAVFITERERGKSAKEAAIAAKEITVNFNRKGTLTPILGSYFAFFNASVQGSLYNFVNLGLKWTNRFVVANAALGVIQILAASLSRYFGDEDELGVSDYDRLSDYTRNNNIILPDILRLGELFGWQNEEGRKYGFMTIPMPQSFRAISSVGVIADQMLRGRKDMSKGVLEVVDNVIANMSPLDLEFYNFSTGNPAMFLARGLPTVAQPFVDIVANKNFADRQIYKEEFMKNWEGKVPESSLGLSRTNGLFTAMAQWGNRVANGTINLNPELQVADDGGVERNKFMSWLDWNPAVMEHVVEGLTGGRGRFWNNLYKTIEAGLTEKEVDNSDIPFVRTHRTVPYRKTHWEMFFDIREQVGDVDFVASVNKKAGNYGTHVRVLTKSNQLDNAISFDYINKLVSLYRTMANMAETDESRERFLNNADRAVLNWAKGRKKAKEAEAERKKSVVTD